MLKVAGWIVPDSSITAWREALQELEREHPVWSIRSRAAIIVAERLLKGLEPLPILEEHFIQISWPKMTKENRGKPICMLVRRVNFNAKTESWDNFTPMLISPRDEEIFKILEDDGLKLGEWITVPDPFEKDWPFARRYPGARRPPEPPLEIVNGRAIFRRPYT